MRDRTAQTEPLTIGQQIVARWEGLDSGWGEPADLAEAIDKAIADERERCAAIVYGCQIAFASDACGWALDKIKDGLPADAIQ